MYTVIVAVTADVEVKYTFKSKKIALDVKSQSIVAGYSAKVVMIKEVE